jgi:hypothetical protein
LDRAEWYAKQGATMKAETHFGQAMFYSAKPTERASNLAPATRFGAGGARQEVRPVTVYIYSSWLGMSRTHLDMADGDIAELLRGAYGVEIRDVTTTTPLKGCDYAIAYSANVVGDINRLDAASKPKGLILFANATNDADHRPLAGDGLVNYERVTPSADRANGAPRGLGRFRWTYKAALPVKALGVAGALAATALSGATLGVATGAAVMAGATAGSHMAPGRQKMIYYSAFRLLAPVCKVCYRDNNTLPAEDVRRLIARGYGVLEADLGNVAAQTDLRGCDYAVSMSAGVMADVDTLQSKDKPDGIILWATDRKDMNNTRSVAPAAGYVDMEPVGLTFDRDSSTYIFKNVPGFFVGSTVYYCRILRRLPCCAQAGAEARGPRPCLSCDPWPK